jgi:predicted hydrocarbon binding protein
MARRGPPRRPETVCQELLSADVSHPGVLYYEGARIALLDVKGGFWALRQQLEAIVGATLADSVFQQAGASAGASLVRGFMPGSSQPAPPQAIRECVAAFGAAGFGGFEIETLDWPIGRLVVASTNSIEAWGADQHGQVCDSPACAYTAGVSVGFVNTLDGLRKVVCVQRACQASGADACQFELLPAGAAGNTNSPKAQCPDACLVL